MSKLGVFPFGEPVRWVEQSDRTAKKVFVLGVYASAVHAKWSCPNGKQKVGALAVASEPYIFWRGDGVEALLESIHMPPSLGRLEPAAPKFNGPSGLALDELILEALGLDRSAVWLSDLVPHSCANPAQLAAISREYLPVVEAFSLPHPSVPEVPRRLADDQRREELLEEVRQSKAELLVTLGDQPLRWFLGPLAGAKRRLVDYGADAATYGRLHWMELGGRRIAFLPLAHPRQIARLGRSSQRWSDLHEHWRRSIAPAILQDVAA